MDQQLALDTSTSQKPLAKLPSVTLPSTRFAITAFKRACRYLGTTRLLLEKTCDKDKVSNMPYYAVQNGRLKGVYNDWSSAKEQVHEFRGAVYKKFDTRSEANAFINGSGGYSDLKSNSSAHSARLLAGSRAGVSGSGSQLSRSSKSAYKVNKPLSSSVGGSSIGYVGTLTLISTPKEKSIYTDGAARGNGRASKPASGYGVYHGEGDPKNAAVPMRDVDGDKPSTNQRAELAGFRHALQDVRDSLGDGVHYTLKSDSRYTMDSVAVWLKKWEMNGYVNTKNQPVKNQDLIKDCVELIKQINSGQEKFGGRLKFEYVKGHDGVHGNEQADRLANLGADKDF